MIILLNVLLHCVLSHVLMVSCSDPLLHMVFNIEPSSRVMGTTSQVKQTRSRMECIASCIEPQCSAVIMELCSKGNFECRFNSVYCKHVKAITTSEITLISGQELWSIRNYEVGRTEQNETTINTAKNAITTVTRTTTTQNYATSTEASDTINDGTTTRVVQSDTTLVTTQSNSIEIKEASSRTETTTMVAITAAETTGIATTTGNSNIALGATSAQTTTTTTTEYPDTEATITALIITSTLHKVRKHQQLQKQRQQPLLKKLQQVDNLMDNLQQ